ncbi:hypothetical protein B0H19DRAFT_1180685, partial [Mycena capillaripes]
MAARSVLQVQELCDYIVDFLHNHPGTLKSCALVSPRLASSAQHHLFYEIRFGNGVKWSDAGACQRFCAVLRTSPHLAPLVHRIRACFTPDVLGQLCEIDFPNLHELALFRPLKDNLVASAVTQAARLIGRPSIRHLKLQDLIFTHVEDVAYLFQHCTHAVDSLALSHIRVNELSTPLANNSHHSKLRIKALRIDAIMSGGSNLWLLDPLQPFDLSALEDLDFGGVFSPSWLSLIASSRLSIRNLRIYAQDAVNPRYTKNPIPPTLMARLTALTHLTIGSLGEELQDVETLLDGFPPTNCLVLLRVEIMTRPREDGLRRLGLVCASMECTVEVNLWRFMNNGLATGNMAGIVRTAFVELVSRGRLVVRVNGDA